MRTPTLLSAAVGLIVLSGVFWLIERLRPALPQQRRRPVDRRVDLAYWFFTPLVTRAVTPALRATAPVTVEAGMDAEVEVELP